MIGIRGLAGTVIGFAVSVTQLRHGMTEPSQKDKNEITYLSRDF
jgi:hypothetical protein